MATALLNAVLNFFTNFISLIFTPLNTAIATLLPNTSTTFTYINAFFDLIGDYGCFALSYLGLNTEVISTCILLFTAKIMIPITAHLFKLVAKWWEVLV